MKLRPVTFRYKQDSTDTRQYGLIAEEVEKIYPELVIDGKDGRPEAVAYQVFPAMLLNEVQKLARENQHLSRQVHELEAKNTKVAELSTRLSRLERVISSKDGGPDLADAFK